MLFRQKLANFDGLVYNVCRMKNRLLQILCCGGGMTVPEGYALTWEGLFSRLEQPAFIVRDENMIYQNGAADKLLCGVKPILRECLLPEALEVYRAFDGTGSLLLNLRLGGNELEFTVYRDNGADIFLAAPGNGGEAYHILERTAQAIRRAAHDIYDAQNVQLPDLKLYDDPAVKKSVSRVNKSVCRLERLAGNLEDYSGLRANRRQGRFEKVELAGHFRELCKRMQDLFREVTITFCCGDKTMMGQVDVPLMERAVLNLMTNALRTMEPGGKLELELVRLKRNRAAFRVQDDGAGIEPLSMSGVMYAAKQPLSPLEDPRLGVGLGLSLCMEIARLHGGTLVLQSAPGQGTSALLSFSLSLPDLAKDNVLRFSRGGLDPFLVEISELLPASYFFDI